MPETHEESVKYTRAFILGTVFGRLLFLEKQDLEIEAIEWAATGKISEVPGAGSLDFDGFVDGYLVGYFAAANEALERIKVDVQGHIILDRAFEIVLERLSAFPVKEGEK